MNKIAFCAVVGFALSAVGCGGHQSISPAPPQAVPQSLSDGGVPGAPDISSDDQANIGPLVTVSASVVVTIPSSASATKSVSISVNGGTPVIANTSSGSPGCTGANPLKCTVSVNAPTSSDLFTIKTFNAAKGTGTMLAMGNILQTISTTSKTINLILAATPHSIALALKTVSPRECNPATTIPLYVMVRDSSGNVIIGAYGETVTLKDSDTTGKTILSASTLSNSTTSIIVSYDSHPLQSAIISASASGVTSVTDATLKPLQMIYVANLRANTITVYPSTTNGNVTPTRTISGSNTQINHPYGVAVDGSCNVDVANESSASILVFAAGANGNVAPKRVISGSKTLLSASIGLATDSSENIYVTEIPAAILEFAATANGNVVPIRNIRGTNTKLVSPFGIAIGPTGKIYEGDGGYLLVFAAGANGNVAPLATITDSSKTITNPYGVAVDSSSKIYVADYETSIVSVFAANANGSSTPLQAISGSSSMVAGPDGITVDYLGNIEVANYSENDLLVFAKGSNGNVPPKAIISGSNTGINGPEANGI